MSCNLVKSEGPEVDFDRPCAPSSWSPGAFVISFLLTVDTLVFIGHVDDVFNFSTVSLTCNRSSTN